MPKHLDLGAWRLGKSHSGLRYAQRRLSNLSLSDHDQQIGLDHWLGRCKEKLVTNSIRR